jgi:hypothetical protein
LTNHQAYANMFLMSEKQTHHEENPEQPKSREEQELWLVDTQAMIAEQLEKLGIAEKVKKIAVEKYGPDMINGLTRLVVYSQDKDRETLKKPFGICVISPNMDSWDTIPRTGEKIQNLNDKLLAYIPVLEYNSEEMDIAPGFDRADALVVGEFATGLMAASREGIVPNLSSDLTEINRPDF